MSWVDQPEYCLVEWTYMFFVSLRAATIDAASTNQRVIREEERCIFGVKTHALLDSVHQNILDILPLRN